MAFTKCPNCRRIQQVVPKLLDREVGCMNGLCNKAFDANEYRLHSGPLSRVTFYFVIAFAVYMIFRWMWPHSISIMRLLM